MMNCIPVALSVLKYTGLLDKAGAWLGVVDGKTYEPAKFSDDDNRRFDAVGRLVVNKAVEVAEQNGLDASNTENLYLNFVDKNYTDKLKQALLDDEKTILHILFLAADTAVDVFERTAHSPFGVKNRKVLKRAGWFGFGVFGVACAFLFFTGRAGFDDLRGALAVMVELLGVLGGL